MNIKKGYIYWFKYTKYRTDPQPVVLILWPGDYSLSGPKSLVHGINLNHLSKDLTDDVVRMVTKIASGALSGSNTRYLYYNYMKQKLHPVIKRAYRTYLPNAIRGIKTVSNGFHETVKVVKGLQAKNKPVIIKKLISQKVESVNIAKKIITDPSLHLTAEEAEKRARLYMDEIHKIQNLDNFDISVFTQLLKRK